MTFRTRSRRGEAGRRTLLKLFGSTWTSLRLWPPEKWLSEPVILSLPDAVQEALRAVSRIPFSETAAAGDLGIPAASVMDAVALNPLFPLIPTYRLEDVATEAGPRHNDGLWICGDLRELEKSSPVRWWY